jgi:Family of unknown function (DUF6011)
MGEDCQVGKIEDPAHVKTFLLAGNAVFTLVSLKTGERHTYQVRVTGEGKGTVTHFVSLLNEEGKYDYFGHVYRYTEYTHGRKARVHEGAPSSVAFRWFWQKIVEEEKRPEDLKCEVWHEGRCSSCGRPLSDEEGVDSGIGPECRGVKRGG